MSAIYPEYSPQVLTAFRIVATTFHCLAITATGYRIAHKIITGRLWWDDACVFIAGLLDVSLILCIWGRKWGIDHMIATGHSHLELRIAFSWAESMAYTALLWLARIGILAGTVRLLQPGPLRCITIATCWSFVVAWLSISGYKGYMCKRDTSWHDEWRVDCRLGPSFTAIKISTDVISCTLLIGIPLRMLWHSALPKFERWMIRVVCTSSLLSTAISALHAAYLLGSNRILEGYFGHIEVAISLTVSNILVITTRLYRFVMRRRENAHAAQAETTRSVADRETRSAASPIEMTTSRTHRRSLQMTFTQIDTQDLFPSLDTTIPRFAGGNPGTTFERREHSGRSTSVEIAPISRPKPVVVKDDPDIFLRRIRT